MIKRKGHPTFNVPNFGAKNRSRVKDRWRKPRGIDSKKREAFAEAGAVPKIGYKNRESIRFRRQDGKLERLVHNTKELQGIDAGNYTVVIASGVSRRKRIEIQKIADSMKLKVANGIKVKA
jgi:large subunit ribosomal protein L32e